MSSNVLLSSYSQELPSPAHLPPAIHDQTVTMNLTYDFQFGVLSLPAIFSLRREEGGRWEGLGAKRTGQAFTKGLRISKCRVTTAVMLLRVAGIPGGLPPGFCGPSRQKSGICSSLSF